MAADFDPGTGLGPRLREVRVSRELSVRELARRVGCSGSLISQIERGISVPSVGVLYSLATELGSSLDYLLFGSAARAEAGAGEGPGAGARPGAGAGAAPAAGPRPRGASPPPIVQRGDRRKIIDLASGVRWERLTPQSEAMTDFLEVIYSPGGHSTDERRPPTSASRATS
jgi:transcriptional regulator with XRE-family HTH domain